MAPSPGNQLRLMNWMRAPDPVLADVFLLALVERGCVSIDCMYPLFSEVTNGTNQGNDAPRLPKISHQTGRLICWRILDNLCRGIVTASMLLVLL